jgi:hypothetical protein
LLFELNALLSQSLEHNLERPLLRDFPNIAGIYVLLRTMKLAVVDKKFIRIDEPALNRWNGLNPVGKYFALLEAWLIHASESVLGASRDRDDGQLSKNLYFLSSLLVGKWNFFEEHGHKYNWTGCVSTWNVQLHLRFGLIEARNRSFEDREKSSKGWILKAAKRTPWGAAVAMTILDYLLHLDKELTREDILLYSCLPEDAGFGFFQPAFQTFQPEWQKTFTLPKPTVREGAYLFKVSLDPRYHGGPIWRRLAISGNATLDELAGAVLKAFKFEDDDHLYEFRYRDGSNKTRTYNHPYVEEGPYADEIALAESDLPIKSIMRFLFDFGDKWRFLIRLEQIDPNAPKTARIQVIESEGKAPRQYGGSVEND